jgi:hypothetical protein
MVKLTHIFMMSILIFWLAGSGCVENNTEVEEAGLVPGIHGADNEENTSAGQELTEADVQEFEKNVTDLNDLLENSSLEEEIVIEEL